MNKISPTMHERKSTCEKHGDFVEKGGSFFAGSNTIWFGCPECSAISKAEEDARAKAEEERNRQERIEARLRLAGIPHAFRGKTIDGFEAITPDMEAAKSSCRSFAEDFWTKHAPAGNFLVLAGEPGTGKSHLAIAIANEVMKRGTAMYIDAASIIRRVRSTWSRDAKQTEDDVLRMFGEELDLLIIDEIGLQRNTDDEGIILFDILNRRYGNLRPTILLTNLGAERLAETLGVRLMDRLMERAIFVPFVWESWRGRAA